MPGWTRPLRLLPFLALLGCGGMRSKALPEEGVVLSSYRHVGVLPFSDRTGRGKEVSEAVAAALREAMYEPVDQKALAEIFARLKPSRDLVLDLETLESIHARTSADSVILGKMAPDWSVASIAMVETGMGDVILHAILKPPSAKQKAFSSPVEVAQEMLRVLSRLR